MYLKLAKPYNPGQNDPTGAMYGSLYITQMTDNRTGDNFQFIYEAGDFAEETDADGIVTSTWVKGIGMLSQIATVSGDDYLSAIAAQPLVATDSAYQSIIRLLYMKLMAAGYAGTIEGA